MKMAVCIYGQHRTAEFCAPSLKKFILDIYHPDVFVCSEWGGDILKRIYNPTGIEIYSEDETLKINANRNYSIGEWYNIIGWPQYHVNTKQALSSMFKGWRCREMLREYEIKHGDYDVVFVARPDVKFLYIDPITLPKENTLYLPRIDAHQWPADKDGIFWHIGYSSHTWWSSSELAKRFLASYHWCDESFNETGAWNGEIMVKWFCDKYKVNIQQVDVTQMIIKGSKEHPLSCSFEYGKELSATHYPEYCDPPFPIENKIPVPLPSPGGPLVGGHPGRTTLAEPINSVKVAERWIRT